MTKTKLKNKRGHSSNEEDNLVESDQDIQNEAIRNINQLKKIKIIKKIYLF